jgi:hypothetical protein
MTIVNDDHDATIWSITPRIFSYTPRVAIYTPRVIINIRTGHLFTH